MRVQAVGRGAAVQQVEPCVCHPPGAQAVPSSAPTSLHIAAQAAVAIGLQALEQATEDQVTI
jgi:hypothetical protein